VELAAASGPAGESGQAGSTCRADHTGHTEHTEHTEHTKHTKQIDSAAHAAGLNLSPAAHLEWAGDIPDPVAQRIACDADIWAVIADPVNSRPLEVGRAYRLVPYWIRKALHARDRGCRFPGCRTPTAWTDAHHITHWADGGPTDLDNLILLCRFHHGLVHEVGWTIHHNIQTGMVTATRPDGRPYEITA
jgi:hypothetical protein